MSPATATLGWIFPFFCFPPFFVVGDSDKLCVQPLWVVLSHATATLLCGRPLSFAMLALASSDVLHTSLALAATRVITIVAIHAGDTAKATMFVLLHSDRLCGFDGTWQQTS